MGSQATVGIIQSTRWPPLVEVPVVELPAGSPPQPGEQAPDFRRPLVTETHWTNVSLSELTNQSAVAILFYPLNWGGKSVYWWNEIRDREWGSEQLRIVGVGISQPFDHQRFIEAREMDYAIFSDPSNAVADRYDIVHDLDGMAGVEEPIPAMFVVDTDREIEHRWVASEWPETPPFDRIEEWFSDRL